MKNAFRLALLLAFVCLLPLASASAQQQNSIAFERAQHLQHGINTSMWFAQANNYSVQRLETFTTPKDIKLIAEMGFDHCRLSIASKPLLEWERAGHETPFMQQLDKVVHEMLAQHLSVIIDVHPSSQFKATLCQGQAGVENFARLWHALAAHFAPVDPNHIFFEMLNEPEQSDPYRWQGIQATLVQTIRQVAPDNTIIAAGAHYSGLPDLLVMEPLDDPNIIYTFHDYLPMHFTHQGATWAGSALQSLHGIPYPSTPENIAPKLSQEPTLASQFSLDQYGEDHWDAQRIDNYISFAAKWSKLHHVPVYCGEFGVYRAFAPPAARAAWLHDMRAAMEKYHIGWAMWDYQGGFSVVTKANGVTTPDPLILKALGLHMPEAQR